MNNHRSPAPPWPKAGMIALGLALGLCVAPAAFAADDESAAPEAPAAGSVDADDLAVLESQLRELREMLTSFDTLRANLVGIAEKAQNDADAAPDRPERRRYEQLYTETGARIAELDRTRADMVRLLGELESRLETLRRGR